MSEQQARIGIDGARLMARIESLAQIGGLFCRKCPVAHEPEIGCPDPKQAKAEIRLQLFCQLVVLKGVKILRKIAVWKRGYRHGWQSYVCRVDEAKSPISRNRIMERLEAVGIMQMLKEGIALDTVTRPINHTSILK